MALSKDDIFASEEEELNLMTLFADDEEKPADDKPADDDKGDDNKKDDDKKDDDDDEECCKSSLAYEAFMFENCDDLFEESGDKSDPDAASADDKGDDDKKDDDKKDEKKDDDKPADDDKGGDDKPENGDDDNKPEKEEGKECGLNSDEDFAFDAIDVFACGVSDCEQKADEEPEIDAADSVNSDASNSLLNDALFSGISDF